MVIRWPPEGRVRRGGRKRDARWKWEERLVWRTLRELS